MFNLTNLFKKKFTYPKPTQSNYTGYKALIADEIVKVRDTLKQHISPAPPTIIENTSEQVIWQISFSNSLKHYMRLNYYDYRKDDGYIVYVDTELLYLVLLNDGLKNYTDYIPWHYHNLRQDIPHARKYHHAEKWFSKSIEKPIPLALIYVNDSSISFTDGITRTMWLIANHALSFPIFTHGAESANLLNDLVGLTDQPFKISVFIK